MEIMNNIRKGLHEVFDEREDMMFSINRDNDDITIRFVKEIGGYCVKIDPDMTEFNNNQLPNIIKAEAKQFLKEYDESSKSNTK